MPPLTYPSQSYLGIFTKLLLKHGSATLPLVDGLERWNCVKARLVVVPEPQDVYASFAREIADEIKQAHREQRELKLIFPIGPVAHYPLLAAICNSERISFQGVFISLMDEYLDWQGRPIPTTHSLSFKSSFEQFLNSLDVDLRPSDEQWVVPDPFDIDRIESFFNNLGGVDVCYGGVGVNGHIAFNEPPVSKYGSVSIEEFANSKTRVVSLTPETFVINALRSAGGDFSDFPTLAVTIGMELILSSKKVRLYCDGGIRQNEAIYQYVKGPVSVSYPITLLQSHPDTILLADELSAAKAMNVN